MTHTRYNKEGAYVLYLIQVDYDETLATQFKESKDVEHSNHVALQWFPTTTTADITFHTFTRILLRVALPIIQQLQKQPQQ